MSPLAGLGEINSISVMSATAAALGAAPGFVVPVQPPAFSHGDGRGVSLTVSKLPASLPPQRDDICSRQQAVSAKSWRSSSSESSTASSMLGSTLRKEPLWLRPAAMHVTVPIPPATTAAAVGVSCCCCLSSSSSSSSVSTSSSNTSATSIGVECATGGLGGASSADTSHTNLSLCRTSSAVAASAGGLLVREGDFRTEDSGTNA